MCVAIPRKILKVMGDRGIVAGPNEEQEVDLSLVTPINAGQYVIVCAGFAISVVQEDEAQKTLLLFNEIDLPR